MYLVSGLISSIIRSRQATLFATLLIICIIISTASNAYATGVKIVQVQYPSTVSYGSTVNITVHIQAAFSNSPSNGQYGILMVSILNVDNNNTVISGAHVTVAPIAPLCGHKHTSCELFVRSPSVDQTFEFTFSPSDMPASSVWHLEADASTMNPCSGCASPIPFASASYSFSITVSQ